VTEQKSGFSGIRAGMVFSRRFRSPSSVSPSSSSPEDDEGDRNLLEKTIPALMPLKPDFCSVTYGAGGSTRDKR